MSSLQKHLLKKSLPPAAPKAFLPSKSHGSHGGRKRHKKDYSPLPWSDFFDRFEDVRIDNNCFRVYLCGTSGPVLLLLHGGGHSALSWAVFTVAVRQLIDCQVAAMDIRGHGHTVTEDDDDLSSDTLVGDIGAVAMALYGEKAPPIVLMGHSMGGAIAVRAAARGVVPALVGLAVIDVVEGTAMNALVSMQGFLRGRPTSFKSLEQMIEWSIRSGQLGNVQSARVSMPGQMKRVDTSEPVEVRGESVENFSGSADSTRDCTSEPHHNVATETITEEGEGEGEQVEGGRVHQEQSESGSTPSDLSSASTGSTLKEHKQKSGASSSEYTWRIDLTKTQHYWAGWFEGLSSLFLTTTIPKILILAGVDRLDKELTIGQMQGKFQMVVLSGCGHAVHEDAPDKVAQIIAEFLVRHKFTQPKEGFQRPFPAC